MSVLNATSSRLTVVSKPFKIGRHYYVLCDCACGTKGYKVRWDAVRSGRTKSCGCLRGKALLASKWRQVSPGQKFYELEILKIYPIFYRNTNNHQQKDYLCDCRCSCGTVKRGIRLYNILSGLTKSCGCLAEKKRKERIKYFPNAKVGIYTLLEPVGNPNSRSKADRDQSNRNSQPSQPNQLSQTWLVRCECGNIKIRSLSTIKISKRCTCKKSDSTSKYLGKSLSGRKVLRVFYKKQNQYAETECLSCGRVKAYRLSMLVADLAAPCPCKGVSRRKRKIRSLGDSLIKSYSSSRSRRYGSPFNS